MYLTQKEYVLNPKEFKRGNEIIKPYFNCVRQSLSRFNRELTSRRFMCQAETSVSREKFELNRIVEKI